MSRRKAVITPEGLESRRQKIRESLTPQRRQQFAEETKEARKLAKQVQKQKADEFARRYLPTIKQMRRQGLNLIQIAEKMNAAGHTSPRGSVWTDQTVRQILKRLKQPLLELEDRLYVAEKMRKKNANDFAKRYYELIKSWHDSGLNLTEIAEKLNATGHVSRRGAAWTYHSVGQVLKRTKALLKPEIKVTDLSSEVLGAKSMVQRQMPIRTSKRIIGWDKL